MPGPTRSRARALPAALGFVGGIGVSTQVFFNGRLADSLDDPIVAAIANAAIAIACLALAAVATGVPRRVVRLTPAQRPRPWQLVPGLNTALFTVVTAAAAPKVGVAVLTVAIVCGQTTGSLVVDGSRISPAGRRPPSVERVLGATLAIAAVSLGAIDASAHLELGLLALAVVAGLFAPVQQAAMGGIARRSGVPLLGALTNLSVGLVTLVVVLLVTGGGVPSLDAPPIDWIGGVIGSFVIVMIVNVVGRIGVLRLMLLMTAGQATGALLLDLVAPVPGKSITAITITSVLLTFVAVHASEYWRLRRPEAWRRASR